MIKSSAEYHNPSASHNTSPSLNDESSACVRQTVGLWSGHFLAATELADSSFHYVDVTQVSAFNLKYLTSLYAFIICWEGEQCLDIIHRASSIGEVPTIVAHESLASTERVRVRAAGADFITPLPFQDELIRAIKMAYQRRIWVNQALREQNSKYDTRSHVSFSKLHTERSCLVRSADHGAQQSSQLSENWDAPSSSEVTELLSQTNHTNDKPELQTLFRIGPLVLDTTMRRVSVRGEVVPLSTRPYDLLCYLIQNVGRCCSREELLEEVWDLDFDPTTNVVDVQICGLRRILSQHDVTDLIRTVRGSGYMMVAPA